VADKNCEKIHYIAPNIYCCGAGTAADTMNVTAMISSSLDLHRYATGRQSRVVTAMTMLKSHLFRHDRCAARLPESGPGPSGRGWGACAAAASAAPAGSSDRAACAGSELPLAPACFCARRYQGHVSAALVLGGVDLNGPHLFTVRRWRRGRVARRR
jgi:hypothetical protein